MHILVTNDDGVLAPGILALAQVLRPLGKVTVLAPDHNWSASGHVKTLHRPLRVKEVTLEDGSQALASDGAPSDCVALAQLGLLREKIDLVVSGINPYCNLGHDVTYSGTVTAAMEGAIWGIPSIAFSANHIDDTLGLPAYQTAANIARQITERVIKNGLPPNILLNVNIPNLPADQILGYRVTRQGLRIYHDQLVERTDPMGRPYYWIGGGPPTGVIEEGTDVGGVLTGYVAITPLELDMTGYEAVRSIGSWDWPTSIETK
jgi:5'-nucleotidase